MLTCHYAITLAIPHSCLTLERIKSALWTWSLALIQGHRRANWLVATRHAIGYQWGFNLTVPSDPCRQDLIPLRVTFWMQVVYMQALTNRDCFLHRRFLREFARLWVFYILKWSDTVSSWLVQESFVTVCRSELLLSGEVDHIIFISAALQQRLKLQLFTLGVHDCLKCVLFASSQVLDGLSALDRRLAQVGLILGQCT